MTLVESLFELGIIIDEIVSIFSGCVLESGVDMLVPESDSSVFTSAIKDYAPDEADKNYEDAIYRITLCIEKARPLLNRIGRFNLTPPPSEPVVGELTLNSVSHLAEEVHTLNTYVGLVNRLIRNRPIDTSKKSEVALVTATKQGCNTIVIAVNKILMEHNTYFAKDKSMQVNLVDLVD
jgi:hypothetical protein